MNQQIHFFFLAVSAKLHKVSNLTITFLCCFILTVVPDYLWKIHRICCAMYNMSALKSCTCLMCHRMYDSKQCVGKSHACKALRIMHLSPCIHIAMKRLHQVFLDHLNCPKCKRVCVVTVCRRYICFNCMRHRIHPCMRYQLGRHCLCKVWVNNCHIRRNLEISNWIFNPFLIICNNRKCSNFRCSSRCRRDCTKMCLCTEFRKAKHLAHILKSSLRIFVFNPHCFCCVNRGTASHCHFKKFNFHASFFQVSCRFVQKTVSLHGTAADTNNSSFSLKSF